MTDPSDTERVTLRRLADESACRQLLERYTFAVDWMNWAGLEALFWPDARFDFGLWSGSRDGFIPWVGELESGYARRLHHFSMPRLDVAESTGRAEVGAMMCMRIVEGEGADTDELMFGRYQFGFEKRDGEWRLSRLDFLLHGVQRFPATENGGAPFFADGLTPQHPRFAQ